MVQGVEHRAGETTSEFFLNLALSEHVYRAPDGEVREVLGADPNGLAVIDESDRRLFDGVGDGCRFTVIESLGGRAADKGGEARRTDITELNLVDEALLDQQIKSVGVSSARPSTELKLQRDILDDNTSIGQGAQDGSGASGGVQIDDDARIGDDRSRAFIKAT